MSMDPDELRTAEDIYGYHGQQGVDAWLEERDLPKKSKELEEFEKFDEKYKKKEKKGDYFKDFNKMMAKHKKLHIHKDNGKGYCKTCGKDMTRKKK